MRISDDRYTRDRRRLDLALRLIGHEARTCTIREWTGLSEDRIRKLYRSHGTAHGAGRVTRHRGKAPRQASFFFKGADRNFHSSQLASLFVMYGLLQGTEAGLESRYRVGSLESGTRLCQAYEAYLELHSPACISFDHAWLLLSALGRREEIGISRCEACGGAPLQDLLGRRKLACGNCSLADGAPAPPMMNGMSPC